MYAEELHVHVAELEVDYSKTRKLIGLLYRWFYKYSSCNKLLILYVSFIRPHLKYAGAAWNPFLNKDVIEDVQKFAVKVCLKSWNSTYDELLEQSPPSLMCPSTSTGLKLT